MASTSSIHTRRLLGKMNLLVRQMGDLSLPDADDSALDTFVNKFKGGATFIDDAARPDGTDNTAAARGREEGEQQDEDDDDDDQSPGDGTYEEEVQDELDDLQDDANSTISSELDVSVEQEILDDLRNHFQRAIEEKFRAGALPRPNGLARGINPYDHQLHAAQFLVNAVTAPFKGAILADPPALGKTLSVLMAILTVVKPTDGPCVYVAPASCCRQVVREVRRFCGDVLPILLIDSSSATDSIGNLSAFDLFKYRLVVVSYSRVMSEFSRAAKFLRDMEAYKAGETKKPPRRPTLSIMDEVLFHPDARRMGPVLVLDEVHMVKNIYSVTYAAVHRLRDLFTACIMMTGTPLGNRWDDCYALLSLLQGHKVSSKRLLRQVFAEKNVGKKMYSAVPTYPRTMPRICQLLDPLMLRRPSTILTETLPPKHHFNIAFDLDKDDKALSNSLFEEFKKKAAQAKARKAPTSKEKMPWQLLLRAQQVSYHPGLQDIAKVDLPALQRARLHGDAVDVVQSKEDAQLLDEWLQKMEEGDTCLSARVRTIVDIYNQSRDLRQGTHCLIMDDSVCFLHILEIALRKMWQPVKVFRFDGRSNQIERDETIKRFAGCDEAIMLCSRGAGGQGLNLQCANIIIKCGPWWNAAWDEQAVGRIWRPGQHLPVYVWEIRAKACLVENHKRTVRDSKNRTNTRILMDITHAVGQNLPRPRIII